VCRPCVDPWIDPCIDRWTVSTRQARAWPRAWMPIRRARTPGASLRLRRIGIRAGEGRSPAGNRFEGPHPAFRTSGSASCSILRWRSRWPLVTAAAVTAAAAVTTVAESCSSALLAPNFEDRKSPALSGSPVLVLIYPSCLLAVSHCRSIMGSFRSSDCRTTRWSTTRSTISDGSSLRRAEACFCCWGSAAGVLVLPLRSATQHC